MNSAKAYRLVTRAWYYFRLGYSTYLTFLLGYASTLITVYFLAIKNMPVLLDIFPNFALFSVIATVVGVPLSIGIGWLHLKRTLAYTSEMDITAESNPYSYKAVPGKEKEVQYPIFLESILLLQRLAQSQNLLTQDEKDRLENLERKVRVLVEGGLVGTPRKRI